MRINIRLKHPGHPIELINIYIHRITYDMIGNVTQGWLTSLKKEYYSTMTQKFMRKVIDHNHMPAEKFI